MGKNSLIKYDNIIPHIDGRDPSEKPTIYLEKDGENSYKIIEGRRPSKMLLVNKLRHEVDKWREEGYPGVTNTTRELLDFWFENDHIVDGNLFKFWFAQREAIETLIYLFEVKKYDDIKPIIEDYAKIFHNNKLIDEIQITETSEGRRKLIRYYPELDQYGIQDLPEKNLLRYAFKMATGSGKTFVMALIVVWSYLNRIIEGSYRYADNFLILAPNVIVYERLAKDFDSNKIFYKYPFIPPHWKHLWNIKVLLREDNSPFNPSGNLIVNNIQQLYASKKRKKDVKNIIEEIIGIGTQKNLSKSEEHILDKIKSLNNLIVMNDEAHHVHNDELKWNETLLEIHHSIKNGISLWLDFSATPKTQTGSYYPWIIVDYPLAQAVEDGIVKSPLILHKINKQDPQNITKENIIEKYGSWINAALDRWKEHYEVYSKVGKKPVLFIMTEKNNYADKIAEYIRKQKKKLDLQNPEEEVLVIHVKSNIDSEKETEIKISDKDLPKLRKLARDVDSPDNNVKIIVSNLMLREGWDVQNVTIILGLRPFTSKAKILPEQAVGRGLRLMRGISADYIQTLEVMGTEAFENFVKELEKEGVGINTVKRNPPLPVYIEPLKSKLKYDIEIPQTTLRYTRNILDLSSIKVSKLSSLFDSDVLGEDRKTYLKVEFMPTGTEVGMVAIDSEEFLPTGHELISYITNEVAKRAKITGKFNELYPIVSKYILERCFNTKMDIEDKKLRKHLNDVIIRESIIDILSKEIGKLTLKQKKIEVTERIKLSQQKPFVWRRKTTVCKKTVFNMVAVYNNFEKEFAEFLDRCADIDRFASLVSFLRVDYFSSKGSIRFYYPDFIAVQKEKREEVFWIIETKGREFDEVKNKDKAIKRWCEDVSKITGNEWKYIRVPQKIFESNKEKINMFEELVNIIKKADPKLL